MSKLELVKVYFQQHAFCILIMAFIILLAVIVLLGGDNRDLVNYFSFACALTGIFLALVVIFYTWIDSADTRNILTDLRVHLTSIRGEVGKTAGTLDEIRANVLGSISREGTKSQFVTTDTEGTKENQQNNTLPFGLSKVSFYSMCLLYCLVKSFKDGQKFVLFDVVEKMCYAEEEAEAKHVMDYIWYAIGAFAVFNGLIGAQFDVPIRETAKIENMPSKVCDAVLKYFEEIETGPPEKYGVLWRAWKQSIDDYFTASAM